MGGKQASGAVEIPPKIGHRKVLEKKRRRRECAKNMHAGSRSFNGNRAFVVNFET